MRKQSALLPGTLDLLILTGRALSIEQGALYPALHRLKHRGLLACEWEVSENNRRARYYRLTNTGRKELEKGTESWNRLTAARNAALKIRPGEL